MTAGHPDHAARRFAAIVSLAVGVGMLGGKWAAFGLTGSRAILSDALESIVHVVATAFALTSISLGARPPDTKYPYGYGKIGYFSAGFEGALIVLAAFVIFFEGAKGAILGGEAPRRLDVGLLLILAASVVNLVARALADPRGEADRVVDPGGRRAARPDRLVHQLRRRRRGRPGPVDQNRPARRAGRHPRGVEHPRARATTSSARE